MILLIANYTERQSREKIEFQHNDLNEENEKCLFQCWIWWLELIYINCGNPGTSKRMKLKIYPIVFSERMGQSDNLRTTYTY